MKSLNKIRHLAVDAFIRPERSEVLNGDLQNAERRIELIKQTCESTLKTIALCLQCPNKDGQPHDKRLKKVPEWALGSNMLENSKAITEKPYEESVLGQVLTAAAHIEQLIGQARVKYEDKIEESILGPIQKLMENEIPSIYKLKRTLSKLTSDMDNANAKLTQAKNHRHSLSSSTTGKIDNIKDDLEDIKQKVDQCRDNLAAEMYQLIAREPEISQYIVNFLQYQRDYNKTVQSFFSDLLPDVENTLANAYHKPVYGVDLEEHLNGSGRTIAYPLELCVCGLMLTGLEEEGLFRIAGGASKVKKLKAAFDAGFMNWSCLQLPEYLDPHVIGNALKCYLRELPKPLLTYELHDDWIEAVQVENPKTRLQHIWTVVQKLQTSHKPNYDNLRYLIKFLFELREHENVNKMSSANIAIVIGPNLLWKEVKTDDPAMGMNMAMTQYYTSLVDQLVSYAGYFFGEEVLEFFITCEKPSDNDVVLNGQPDDATNLNPNGGDNEGGFVSAKRSQSNSSLEDHNNSPPPGSPKPFLRRKNKPAPVPPVNISNSSKSSSSSTPTNKVAPVEVSKPPIPTSSPSSSPSNKGTGSDNSSSSCSSLGDNTGLKRLPSTRRVERDGVWIPPSPNQMNNRKLMVGKDNDVVVTKPKVTPPKPPQPVFSQQHHHHGAGGKETNTPVQIYATTLRHKSSFNSGVGATSSNTDNTTQNPNSSSSSNQANSSLQYSNSLPRGFHTENSYKNQRAPRPPSVFAAIPTVPVTNSNTNTTTTSSPPSSASASSAATTAFNNPNPIDIKKGGSNVNRHSQQEQQLLDEYLSEQPSQHTVPLSESNEDHQADQVSSSTSSSINNNIGIGFENIETEVRKLSVDSNNSIPSQQEKSIPNNSIQQQAVPSQTLHSTSTATTLPTDRPVPAPRSSLLLQNNSSSSTKEKDMPIVKERPSLMAKPRDLAKRTTTFQCPNSGGTNNEPKSTTTTCEDAVANPSHQKPQGLQNSTEDSRTIDGSASSDVRNGEFMPPPQSPQSSRNRRGGGLSAFRVNLPQPPPNPNQQQKSGPRAESTDL